MRACIFCKLYTTKIGKLLFRSHFGIIFFVSNKSDTRESEAIHSICVEFGYHLFTLCEKVFSLEWGIIISDK